MGLSADKGSVALIGEGISGIGMILPKVKKKGFDPGGPWETYHCLSVHGFYPRLRHGAQVLGGLTPPEITPFIGTDVSGSGFL